MSIPYARPYWDEAEAQELRSVLESGWWGNGPAVARFEQSLREATGAKEVVCVSSGTAALHAILHLLGADAERALMVTSSLNFAAAASCALLTGYDIAFTDVDPVTLNMSPASLDVLLRRRAGGYDRVVVIPVHYAGLPAPMPELIAVCRSYDAVIVEDACHAIGARYTQGGSPVGSHPETLAAVFSFHPTKPVAAAEGGAIALGDAALARKLRLLRNHNMEREHVQVVENALDDGQRNPWYYEILAPGVNFRLSDVHAAIGIAQLARLPRSLARRHALSRRYHAQLEHLPFLRFVPPEPDERSGLHLFPLELDLERLGMSKRHVFEHFKARGIGLQVHYVPLHQQPAFASRPLVREEEFPSLERVIRGLASFPLYYGLSDEQQDQVITAIRALVP